MSAYMMSDVEICTLAKMAAHVADHDRDVDVVAREWAEYMHYENARALQALYGDPIPEFKWVAPPAPPSTKWVLEKMREYKYQACDSPDWRTDGTCIAANLCELIKARVAA